MAIRKISRLQHRRGLKVDLPPKLHEGEFGWCVDTRELFIGNSEAFDGNSQVLTQWTPNDQLIQHTYKGSTGIKALATTRSIGSKLDDICSVRDYGAFGNGVKDDTAAIQKAIHDRYNKAVANGYSMLNAYVTIFLPAGEYLISDSIKLWPNVKLQGEGSGRTIIRLTNNSATCAIETADSDGNTGANIATMVYNISLEDLTVYRSGDGDVININRASNVRLERLRVNALTDIVTTTLSAAGVRIQSFGSMFIPKNITLNDCDITLVKYGVYSDDPIENLRIILCNFNNCVDGVTLGDSAVFGGPTAVKVTNCNFNSIRNRGIYYNGSNFGVVSTANSFITVGSNTVSPIYWGATSKGCSSLGDQFIDTVSQYITNLNPGENNSFSSQKVSFSRVIPDRIGPMTLANNHPVIVQDLDISYDPEEFNTIMLDYSLSRSNSKRVGRLTVITNGATALLQDEFTTFGSDLGITFGYRISSGLLILTYTSTNTGFDAEMYYTETKWLT